MIEPWNDKSVLPPPMNTFLCKNKKDIRGLRHITNYIIQVLSKQSPLHQESAVLSRFVYKFDKKFRNDMGYRNFKKVNTALKKYLTLNLSKDIQRFVSLLPNKDDEELYLPTQQMLEYILVRIMSFTKVMSRVVVCCKQAAIFYLDRIQRGESHWMSLMPYALLSRIWSITQVLLQHSCNWYNQLYPTLEVLQPKGLNFLPAGYNLPNNLELWCDLKNLNEYGNFEWAHKNKINKELMILNDSDGLDQCSSILDLVNQLNENGEALDKNDTSISSLQKMSKTGENLHTIFNENDIGVPISRDKLQMNKIVSKEILKEDNLALRQISTLRPKGKLSNKKELNEVKDIHSIENISNNNGLQVFLEKEEGYRNSNHDIALTGHLSLMQWLTLKASLLKLLENKHVPRKLSKRIQNIWNEKCNYYK